MDQDQLHMALFGQTIILQKLQKCFAINYYKIKFILYNTQNYALSVVYYHTSVFWHGYLLPNQLDRREIKASIRNTICIERSWWHSASVETRSLLFKRKNSILPDRDGTKYGITNICRWCCALLREVVILSFWKPIKGQLASNTDKTKYDKQGQNDHVLSQYFSVFNKNYYWHSLMKHFQYNR